MLPMIAFSVLMLLRLSQSQNTNCRFASKYTVSDVISNSETRDEFINEYLEWEQKFINTPDVSINPHLSVTYDGSNLNFDGTKRSNHAFSASSKESLHLMYLLHSMNDTGFKDISSQINTLNTKLNAYDNFNKNYPGFGGFIPWFIVSNRNGDYYIEPSGGWENQTPALDNGQMYWALYGIKWGLLQNYQIIINNNINLNINNTIDLIDKQLNIMQKSAKTIFYTGNGNIRWVSHINDTSLSPDNPKQKYTGGSRPGDPYEGELFQWLLDFKSTWDANDSSEIWSAALNNLYAVNYTFKDPDNNIISIVVQKGWHFSAHEQWKILELPYLDNELIYTIFENCEIVRTLNSDFGTNGNNGALSGMYASVNGPIANWSCPTYYVGDCGIPSIADNSATWEYDTITPYGTMSIWLFNSSIASGWLLNIMKGPSMQNIFGTTESTFINGTAICPMVTWDSKITTYIGVKGGISYWTAYGLKQEGLYDHFINTMTKQYEKKFGNNVNTIKANYGYGVPDVTIPTKHLNDFPNCS